MPLHQDQDAVLITGATGFVGAAVLRRYLDENRRPVVALVRAESDAAAQERLRGVLAELYDPWTAFAHARRCTAVAADLLKPELGLSPDRTAELAQRVDEVVHCAASVSFDQPLEAARAVNVDGAGRMARLAERCQASGAGLRRFVHVSTAYVAGVHDGSFGEGDQVAPGRTFRNTYEQTKHEAEQVLRRWPAPLPLQIVRPSIIVGDRDTGWTQAFNVMYWPLQMFARGRLPMIPAEASAPVDVVPVDYVADGIKALERSAPGTYHLVAGEHASDVGEVIALAAQRFSRTAPQLVAPQVLEQAFDGPLDDGQRRALGRARVYFPYFSLRVRFDDRRTRAALASSGLRATPLASYFDRLMDYAEQAQWGRSPVAQRELLAA